MFGRARSSRPPEDPKPYPSPPEDPAVPLVERILETAAARNPVQEQQTVGRRVVTHALWICACYSMNDAPVWLIYDDTDQDGIAWCRLPDWAEEVGDLVDARLIAGGHTEPETVLLWLQGKVSDPWAGDFGDADVLEELGRKIRHV